jgi:hypothetical protein
MTLPEIKEAVSKLSPTERHELLCWMEREQGDYDDLPEEARRQIEQVALDILDEPEAGR